MNKEYLEKYKKPVSEQDFKKSQDTIFSYVNKLQERNKELKSELFEYEKDEEIQKLQDEISCLRRNSIHITTEKENQKLKEFRDKHYKSCKGNPKVIITYTGIGSGIEVQCNKCGKTEDITDYDCW